jgi:L,D-transpeptidase ErfK/SrfK
MKRKQSARGPSVAAALGRWTAALLSGMAFASLAETLQLEGGGSDLVGEIRYATARQEDTLIDIARRYSVGQDEIVMANPTVDRWLPKAGTRVLLPKRMILPDAPRAGIVVNIPEMRLYYYPVKYAPAKPKPVAAKAPAKPPKPGEKAAPQPKPKPQPAADLGEPIGSAGEVITYPISIGRMDWHTPLGKTKIVAKVKDPVWVPPASIKKEHAAQGEILPDVVPAGPDNPLGQYAMRLGVAGYLIHGVDRAKADGIGMRVTHGCVRMYPEDVEKLFARVAVGTPVYMVNQSIKLGWDEGKLYMEVHQPLDEDSMSSSELYSQAMELIDKKTAGRSVQLNREAIRQATAKPSGLPVEIGRAGAAVYEAGPSDSAPEPAPRAAAPKPYRPDAETYADPDAAPAPPVRRPYRPDPDPYAAPPARSYGEDGAQPAPARPYTPATRPVPRPADPYAEEDTPAAPSRPAAGATTYPYGAAPPARTRTPAYSPDDDDNAPPALPRPSTPRYPAAPQAPAGDPYAPEDSSYAPAEEGSVANGYRTPAARRPAAPQPAADPYEPATDAPAEPGNDPYAPY